MRKGMVPIWVDSALVPYFKPIRLLTFLRTSMIIGRRWAVVGSRLPEHAPQGLYLLSLSILRKGMVPVWVDSALVSYFKPIRLLTYLSLPKF